MYKQEKIKPYDADSSKSEQVEQMFDNIAHSYDQLNHFLSLGIDKRWRRAAIKQLRRFEPKEILDVATGTGDFAILSTRSLCPNQVVGIDISEGMLKVARQKAAAAGLSEKIQFKKEDCLDLSFEENSFDAVQVAYGVRNFEDLDKGLSEMFRVLKPGGHAVIVELSSPRRFPMRQLFQLYARVLMPLVGRLISKDTKAYSYLPASMEAVPQGRDMQKIMEKAGFKHVFFKSYTFGLNTMYVGEK